MIALSSSWIVEDGLARLAGTKKRNPSGCHSSIKDPERRARAIGEAARRRAMRTRRRSIK